MKKIKIRFGWLVTTAAIILLTSCENKERPQFIEFRILETSDVHGAIYPYDFIRDEDVDHSLAQVHSYVQKLRFNPELEVILLDNGDILQGQPAVYYSNFEDSDALHICSKVMNYMNYDVATIGNHDIEAGHPVYDKLVDEFSFPWLAANALDKTSGDPYFEPYAVLNRHGIKIAVLGLITPGIPRWLPENLWEGLEFAGMVETAKYWVREIIENEKPDVLIGLFHSGHDAAYGGTSDTAALNENASLLVAEQVPGFDVVFIGHDHDTYNAFITNVNGEKVLVLDPGSSARLVSEASIRMTWNDDLGAYSKEIRGNLIETRLHSGDSEFLSYFQDEFEKVKAYVSGPVGYFGAAISSSSALFGDSPFMDLIHEVQLEVTGAPISFAAPLSMNATIDSGTVYVRDLFRLYRFENFLYIMELTGAEIKDYLEYSYDLWFNTMSSENDHLLRFRELSDSDGNAPASPRLYSSFYNFDSAEGIEYIVDVSKEAGSRITITSLADGSEFVPEIIYKVAINSYRGSGGGGHLTRGAGIPPGTLKDRIVFSTGKDLRYYMMQWLSATGPIEPEASDNWMVIPQTRYQKGCRKDYELLYGRK